MINVRIVERAAFEITGKKTWISGPDNEQFGRFWDQCKAEGLLEGFHQLRQGGASFPGPQTQGVVLGVSRVEQDPQRREFYYMIAIEAPAGAPLPAETAAGLERYRVPAGQWAVFECQGKVPESIVASEMYAFMQWLPGAPYQHAFAPEMEVYLPGDDENRCEFWLPVIRK
jgi:AraC family transcriptional regulator